MFAHHFVHAVYKLLGMLKIWKLPSMRVGEQKQKYDFEVAMWYPRTLQLIIVLLSISQ